MVPRRWLDALSYSGPPVIDATYAHLVGAAVLAGAFGLLLVATFIEIRGLLNGFSALILGGCLLGALDVATDAGSAMQCGMVTPVELVMSLAVLSGSREWKHSGTESFRTLLAA